MKPQAATKLTEERNQPSLKRKYQILTESIVLSLSGAVSDSAALWIVAARAPLSMVFLRARILGPGCHFSLRGSS